jgi:tRNA modification GTPase
MNDTIAAQATPSGRGGISIIRVSGTNVLAIAEQLTGKIPKPRHASYSRFIDAEQAIIDEGILLYFPAPHSFTGEEVLELHGHGGPVVSDCLLQRVLQLGARLAKPGEFSERAFLNGKLDLTQAEAIADLIDASSIQAARSAIRSLQGEFSQQIQVLQEALTHLRIYVEAAIDFPEEEIDFLDQSTVKEDLANLVTSLDKSLVSAGQGALLREGMTIVIAGKPNAGKSSLLNCLTGKESAIVTPIAGTTRDVLREYIHLDGMPLHIIDTAGLRISQDIVEQQGIERAWKEIDNADHLLFVVDGSSEPIQNPRQLWQEFAKTWPEQIKVTVVYNKIDLTEEAAAITQQDGYTLVKLSAKTAGGIDLLKLHLKESMGYSGEGTFIARRRHLDALQRAKQSLLLGQKQLIEQRAGELLAEELRQAQQALSEITGEFTSDDLLGRIFSSFCIGK